MQRAIINALLATVIASIFGAIGIWGTAITGRAGTSDPLTRRRQGLPPLPLWYESLWKRSPTLILSGTYICLSVTFALYLLYFAASSILRVKDQLESPYALYEQCNPTAFWIGCAIWLTPLLAALLIFLRSATRLLGPDVGAVSDRFPDA